MEWDHWCNGKSLKDIMQSVNFEDSFVNCYTTSSGWLLPPTTPNLLVAEISSMPFSENSMVFWLGSPSPTFSTFYYSYFNIVEEVIWHKYIWHKRKSLRFSAYAWLAILGKLKTADQLLLRGIDAFSHCSFCDGGHDSHSHMFFTCDFSFTVISSLLPQLRSFLLRPNMMQVFGIFDESLDYCSWEKNFCYFTICCSIYFLWRERNSRRFEMVWRSPSRIISAIRFAIIAKVKYWKHFDELKRRFDLLC
ncbi:hypothetical protein MA16_Dca005832 [Dendrobium catenatum]|uniref:Reverse transcriptase zinc-binding domain-containing protein n=1 Tax=Dendrobium catenatum TaxID=906689 RepID=A0A2I0WXC2_9ASPA|nr:hypothetical protein MA16_Dca005832 [Dendrobium catenatum]